MSATAEGRLTASRLAGARLPGAAPLLLASVACFVVAAYLRAQESTVPAPGVPLSILFLGMGAIVLVGAVVALLGSDRPSNAAIPGAAEPAPPPPGADTSSAAPYESALDHPEPPPPAVALPVPPPDRAPAPGPTFEFGPASRAASGPPAPRPSGLPPSTRLDGSIECATCGRVMPAREGWRRCRTCSRPLCATCLTDSIRAHGTGYCRGDAPAAA